ncbi:MAG: YdcF family protein [Ruminococcus sp.]|nr:YdcF family protein [Ruminococcus sp.]
MDNEINLTALVVRFIIVSLEAVLLWSFLRALPVVCAGNIAGIAVSSLLIIITMFFDKFRGLISSLCKTRGGKAAVIAVSVIIAAGVVYCIVLSVLMARAISSGEDKKADAVIVLGCQIRGDSPSRMLKYRLDRAYDYLCENEDAICIVSGGKGSDEDYTEAEIMKKYLVQKGIDSSRITEEGESTSTRENMLYSKNILDDMGFSGSVCFISDGYHLYRAGLIAKGEGLDAFGISAETELRFLPTYWVREWLTLSYYFVTR